MERNPAAITALRFAVMRIVLGLAEVDVTDDLDHSDGEKSCQRTGLSVVRYPVFATQDMS